VSPPGASPEGVSAAYCRTEVPAAELRSADGSQLLCRELTDEQIRFAGALIEQRRGRPGRYYLRPGVTTEAFRRACNPVPSMRGPRPNAWSKIFAFSLRDDRASGKDSLEWKQHAKGARITGVVGGVRTRHLGGTKE
jgi:hypothetical protein